MHIFQNRFFHWNHEFEPVDLNTMNPIIRTTFFSLIKGSEPFCQPFPHLKMAQSWLFESISWFSFLTIDRINFIFFFTAPYCIYAHDNYCCNMISIFSASQKRKELEVCITTTAATIPGTRLSSTPAKMLPNLVERHLAQMPKLEK